MTSSRIASRVVSMRSNRSWVTRQKQTGRTLLIVAAHSFADA